jgi:hypothetical protein
MLESSMCSACKYIGRFCPNYYKLHGIPTTGVCHKLHPHLAPASAADQENIGIYNQDRNEEESEFQLGSSTVALFWFAAFQIVSLRQILRLLLHLGCGSFSFQYCRAIPILIHLSSLIRQKQPVRLDLFVRQRNTTHLVQQTTPTCFEKVKSTRLPWTSREKSKGRKSF